MKTLDILNNPLTNKDTAFSFEERAKYGLIGRLPNVVETLEQQAKRAYQQFSQCIEPLKLRNKNK